VVLQQFRETCVRLVRFREVIDVDCPRSMAQLEKMLKALDAYQTASSPRGADGGAGGTGAQNVTRQLDETAPPAAAPAPAPTEAAS
jgi:hypothetical protein